MNTKKDYEALAQDLEKHKELIASDWDLRSLKTIEDKIFTRELIEDYGWELPSHITANKNWFKIDENLSAGTWGGKRTIAWEDKGRDPSGLFLLSMRFPTGAYFFGADYDTTFFREFFDELKSYQPCFVDSRNSSLYFSIEQAGPVLRNFDDIVKKYRGQYEAQAKLRKAKKLREELARLEGE